MMRETHPDQGLINLRWAFALIDGLAAAGVRRAVISPGSRSTPLVLACDQHPAIETFTLLDERSAGFFALGQSKAHGMPSVLIATSGSAPTHWYPAVVEAARSKIPLLLLSADRPPELQDWGANQTLDQQRLFGNHARAFYQAGLARDEAAALRQIRQLGIKSVERSLSGAPGPVHINLPFHEPLTPRAPRPQWPAAAGPPFCLPTPRLPVDNAHISSLAETLSGRPGLIVCGPDAANADSAAALIELAHRLAVPLLADPLSGLRFGPWRKDLLLTHYDAFLRRPASELPSASWILRFGAAPVSKYLLAYLERQTCEQILVAPHGDWPDPIWRTDALIRADPSAFRELLSATMSKPATDGWTRRWLDLDRAAATSHQHPELPIEAQIIGQLLQDLPGGSLLFSGNSQPIRQLDSWSGSGSKALRILANRGLSGIDGNVSTVLGLASSIRQPVVALLGDLSLLHDLNGFLCAAGRHAIFILLNNAGGGIFGQLPQARLDTFEQYWLTPQRMDFETLAKPFGLKFHRAGNSAEFATALAQGLREPAVHLIEIPVDRDLSLQRHQAYWDKVRNNHQKSAE